jgi:signal transduction histidine kinase
MCGREISAGILCEKCDSPKKTKSDARPAVKAEAKEEAKAQPVSAPPPMAPPEPPAPVLETSQALALDPFPKAQVVPFRAESVTPAITSVVDLITASGVPAILLGPDRNVKFVTDEAVRLFGVTQSELSSIRYIEQVTGLRVNDLTNATSAGIKVNGNNVLYTLVPMAGGAGGAVLVFRYADSLMGAHASFVTYVRETVFGPLRALRDSLFAAGRSRTGDPLLEDSAATLDQILSSLELAPGVEEQHEGAARVPTVTEIVQRVASRFVAFADLKGIQLQIDSQDLNETFHDHDQLSDALSLMMDNAFHYVPASGQVVIGVRWMEHKGKPLLLFFVMDNGPLVPENLRTEIFEPGFAWNPSSQERTGRNLFRCREFAVAHSGSVWVESKTGKACTFFLRVRPDGVR